MLQNIISRLGKICVALMDIMINRGWKKFNIQQDVSKDKKNVSVS